MAQLLKDDSSKNNKGSNVIFTKDNSDEARNYLKKAELCLSKKNLFEAKDAYTNAIYLNNSMGGKMNEELMKFFHEYQDVSASLQVAPPLRTNPEWEPVVESLKRATRPTSFGDKPKAFQCPFCKGSESLTPGEFQRMEGASGDWTVRSVPNAFPKLSPDSAIYGKCEVIIESPDHYLTLGELSVEHINQYLQLLKCRMIDAMKDERLRYTVIYKNFGKDAGASLRHSHSHVISMELIPEKILRMEKTADVFYQNVAAWQGNVFVKGKHFYTLSPKEMYGKYESWIIPNEKASSIINFSNGELSDLARVLKTSLLAVNIATKGCAFNVLYHSGPYGSTEFPFHIRIMPRDDVMSGYDLATRLPPTITSDASVSAKELKIIAEKLVQSNYVLEKPIFDGAPKAEPIMDGNGRALKVIMTEDIYEMPKANVEIFRAIDKISGAKEKMRESEEKFMKDRKLTWQEVLKSAYVLCCSGNLEAAAGALDAAIRLRNYKYLDDMNYRGSSPIPHDSYEQLLRAKLEVYLDIADKSKDSNAASLSPAALLEVMKYVGIQFSSPDEIISWFKHEKPHGPKDNIEKAELAHREGCKLFDDGKYEDAIKKYEETLRLNPKHTYAGMNMMTAYHELGRTREGIWAVLGKEGTDFFDAATSKVEVPSGTKEQNVPGRQHPALDNGM